MVVLESDSVWIVTTPDKGQDDKFVMGEHESFTITIVGALVDLAHRHRFAALYHLQRLPPTHCTPAVVMVYCVGEAMPVTDRLVLNWNVSMLRKCGEMQFHSGVTPSGVLSPALESSATEGHGPVGASPDEGHEDDQRAGAPLL
ncbi:hypothetical protein llap_27 [Limosa lapponica baueri]|uniref:Uncharacterized protein n=1 Tax=Limosa lapponica baueri TaxID=1758121 RepID=A0A2I0UUC3_LIMLA|nr:hypothetical protein llap_27 [Limosa lapponica baueri]